MSFKFQRKPELREKFMSNIFFEYGENLQIARFVNDGPECYEHEVSLSFLLTCQKKLFNISIVL